MTSTDFVWLHYQLTIICIHEIWLLSCFYYACLSPESRNTKANSGHGGRKRQPKDDASLCRLILNILREQDDAWPFLEPVAKKEFPEYYKVIKKPMDFHTMKIKLAEGK